MANYSELFRARTLPFHPPPPVPPRLNIPATEPVHSLAFSFSLSLSLSLPLSYPSSLSWAARVKAVPHATPKMKENSNNNRKKNKLLKKKKEGKSAKQQTIQQPNEATRYLSKESTRPHTHPLSFFFASTSPFSFQVALLPLLCLFLSLLFSILHPPPFLPLLLLFFGLYIFFSFFLHLFLLFFWCYYIPSTDFPSVSGSQPQTTRNHRMPPVTHDSPSSPFCSIVSTVGFRWDP